MSAEQHTPGPWSIVIDGTCSGAWPHIVGPNGEEVAELNTSHTERRSVINRGFPGTYAEQPKRFERTAEHDQIMADAQVIAAAPVLFATLQRIGLVATGAQATGSRDVDDWREDMARIQALCSAAIAKATGSAVA